MQFSAYLKRFAVERPVVAFVVLAFALSWVPWLTLPPFADGHWGLLKVLVGVGLGPGLAAVILDRLHGTGGAIGTAFWWRKFLLVALPVALLSLSSILWGDSLHPSGFSAASGRELDAIASLAVVLCSSAAGFVFACASTSRRQSLNTIARAPSRRPWLVVGFILPAVFVVLSLPLAGPMGDDTPTWPWADLSAPVAAAYLARAYLFTLLVTCIGEEPGWRGWMLPHLQQRWSPLLSTVVVGATWGLWHYPLFFNGIYPGADPDKVVEYLFLGPLLGIGFTWLFNRTGMLAPCLLLHAGLNNWERILPSGPMYPILMSVFLLALIFVDKMWRRRRLESERAAMPIPAAV